jgi:hypothetical protein
MHKSLIAIAAFIVSAILGSVLLLAITIAVDYIKIATYQRNHPGIGAVTGGIAQTAVIVTPILCGIVGTLIALHRIERRRS